MASFQFEEKMKEKIDALERTVEVTERTRNDRKEEFIESIKDLVSDEELMEKILIIENKMTELEEEKGNLQLRLVDFEDVAISEKLAKNELSEVTSKLKHIKMELSESRETLEAVLKEKEDFSKAVQERDAELDSLTGKIEEMLTANADLSLSKVKLEMKSVELEEVKDMLEEERRELIENISESRKYSEETVKTLIEVQKAHAALNTKMEALQEEHKKCL